MIPVVLAAAALVPLAAQALAAGPRDLAILYRTAA